MKTRESLTRRLAVPVKPSATPEPSMPTPIVTGEMARRKGTNERGREGAK